MNATIPNTSVSKKHYTLEEANRTLPLVKVIVRDIVSLYDEISKRRDRLAALSNSRTSDQMKSPYQEELDEMESSIINDIDKLKAFISELNQLGIELKDPESGLIDFPAMHQGREVYLCWMHGEMQIDHWHELEAGYAGRKSIDDLQHNES